MPENTHDPELQHMYYCIVQKAINQDKLLTKNIPEHIQSLLKPPKIIMERAKQPINEIKKIFSLPQEMCERYVLIINFHHDNLIYYIHYVFFFYRGPIEDNNILQSECDEEIDISKQCVITAFSPIEDFNKLLENGMNSAIGISKFVLRHRNIFCLLYCMVLCSL